MCMECGHIVHERTILTADAPIEVCGQNVRSIMFVLSGHIVKERAILTADAHVEVCGKNVRSIMCVWSVVT